ncbi:hypothetical protein B5807_09795 [Epicoccum nigrum]|uniref:RRM domain-containing protein n=1 Tax=Epicoccum nigrum TaxID=105696 RepID=A0A1Y2LT23_EPING|nr:hypothetical protein B5807_09795 [Epicoccum nigrum]
MVHTTPTAKDPTHATPQPHLQAKPNPQLQRFRPIEHLREPPTAPRIHVPPTPSRSLAHHAAGSLPFAPFTPGMAYLKYAPAQMLFVKNVPAEYTTYMTALFRAFAPLEMKNLYPLSAMTTLMVALPSREAAEAALLRTHEMKVGTAVISVEKYSARQSGVGRQEARKGRGEGFVGGALGAVVEGDEEDGKVQWPVLGEGRELDREVETPVLGKMAAQGMGGPIAAAQKGEKVKWKSWAKNAAGVKAAEESLSSASSAPLLTPSNDSWILKAKLSPSDDEQAVAHSLPKTPAPREHGYNPPLIGSANPRPAVKPGYWLPPISGLGLSSPSAAMSTASKLPLPTWSPHLPSSGVRHPPGFPQLPAYSGGKALASSTFGGQTEGLSIPVDTTAYIRERHCAGCSLCDLLKSRRVWE